MTDQKADEPLVTLSELTRALDEIYELRRLAAYEARVLEAHLDYKSFPKSRRTVAEDQVERLRRAARGGASLATSGISYLSLDGCLKSAGAETSLTRHAWLAERDPASFHVVDTTTGLPALMRSFDSAADAGRYIETQRTRISYRSAVPVDPRHLEVRPGPAPR